MSIRSSVARGSCVILTAMAAGTPDASRAGEADHPLGPQRREAAATAVVASPPAKPFTGFRLDRLSKGHLRIWRAIEHVVAASGPSGDPRSPTLQHLWGWARTSTHVLHVEMACPSNAVGMVGVFRMERVDPTGLAHVAVIQLCPRTIQNANVRPAPDAVDPFVRFEGLTEIERYAEVLAHELAHARYLLENPDRLAEVVAAQGAIDAFLSGAEPGVKRPHQELARRLPERLAVLAAAEAHAESVEAVVLRELAATGRCEGRGASSIVKE